MTHVRIDMTNYIVKIPLVNVSLAQAKYIVGEIYDALEDSETVPGEAMNPYLTEGDVSDEDVLQDTSLDVAYSKHYRDGFNRNPLPDDFPIVE